MIECTECQGKGFYWTACDHPNCDTYHIAVDCEKCNGTGEIDG